MRTFKATPKLVELLGDKWKGTYEIRVLSGEDYIKMGNELFAKDKDVPRSQWNYSMVLLAVRHNGKPLEKDVPPKLLEMLLPDVAELNAWKLDEKRELFLESTTGNPQEKPTSTA